MQKERKMFDRRVVERYIEKGLLTQDEFDKNIKSLPDDGETAQWVHMDLHDTEIGDGAGDSSADEEAS